jgi:flavin reductase (DIM6/NTAB) family NADH-FMN oxidoreductase RutF
MGGETHLVGPVPEGADPDAYDRLRRRILWSLPSGLYVLGTRGAASHGTARRNLMTLNWATQVAVDPKLLAVSVEAAAVSHGLLRDGRVFSLNVLPREERALVRKFVKPLDDAGEPDHLAGVALRPGRTGAPLLASAAAWLECEVRHELPCGSHTLFVGEVVDCGGEPDGLEVLRMEDTRMSYGG